MFCSGVWIKVSAAHMRIGLFTDLEIFNFTRGTNFYIKIGGIIENKVILLSYVECLFE